MNDFLVRFHIPDIGFHISVKEFCFKLIVSVLNL